MVNLGADTAAGLAELRVQAESRMTDTVEFYTVKQTTDDTTGNVTDVKTVLGTTQARVRFQHRLAVDTETAGQMPAVRTLEVHVPVGSVLVGPSVFVKVTGSVSDPGLVGAVFRTMSAPERGQVTAWRYAVEEVS